MARIKVVRGAVEFVEIDQELRGILPGPRRFDQRTGHRLHRSVSIAIFPDKASFDRILPGDIHHRDRSRKHPSGFVYGNHLMLAQPFATRHAAHIGVDHVDRIDMRIGREKRFSFALRGDHGRGFGMMAQLYYSRNSVTAASRICTNRSTCPSCVAGDSNIIL